MRRRVTSRQASTVGRVWSQVGSTTRNRDHASHAHHNTVCRSPTVGPWPQSHSRPQARLWDPRPVNAPVAGPPGPLRPRIAHRQQLAVGHVRADLPLGSLHPLLDLGQKRVSQPLRTHPLDHPTLLPQPHVAGDGVVVTAGQLGRRAKAAGQVVGLQDLHDFLRCPQRPPLRRRSWWLQGIGAGGEKRDCQRGITWPSAGRSLTPYGEFPVAADNRPLWRGSAEALEGWNVFWATLKEGSLHSTLQVGASPDADPLEVEQVFRARVVSLLRDWLERNPQEAELEAFRVLVRSYAGSWV